MGESIHELWAGLDVGSTTVKIAVVEPDTGELLHSRYLRHNARQAEVLVEVLEEAHALYPERSFKVAFCGSGGHPFAEAADAFFVQEVVANALAIRKMHPTASVAIELGGQDAKVVFFEKDPTTGKIFASDMRMNGTCAGGTGAFIDQVAELLSISTEEFEGLAAKGTKVYEISGRCGVFAKTDIQPLLNQGVSREDLALSCFHAIAKQTIGGLAQGMEIRPPVIFEGGPMTFNPSMVRVFKERLGLEDEQAILPDNAEVLVAWGAALSIGAMYADKHSGYEPEHSLDALRHFMDNRATDPDRDFKPFFESEEEHAEFLARHRLNPETYDLPSSGSALKVYLGIDAGSTTTKLVLLDEDDRVVDSFYSSNKGDPLEVLKGALNEIRCRYEELGIELDILGVGTTGYGERLFASALKADFHTVETVAHAQAARQLRPDASFILDIGGQDMKAISVQDGVVTGIILNEACSSGCGSFIETYARSLGIEMEEIAELAFRSTGPSELGSRCTVFMNSSIVTEQRDGKKPEDIIAGICRSVIENVFTKVIRMRNLDGLGSTVVVQGGTFKNDAVLRAFQQHTGLDPVRPERPGEMGAIGIALLTRKHVETLRKEDPAWRSSFIGLDSMELFAWDKQPGQVCTFCSNYCNRTVITFGDGSNHVTGNRCERGEIVTDPNAPETKKIVAEIARKMSRVPDMIATTNRYLVKDWGSEEILPENGIRIGIPRTLEFWASLPYWTTFFKSLGYKVVLSRKSDYGLFEEGLSSVPSDTICFPAKLAHGHVLDLVDKKVDRIFYPMMTALPSEHRNVKATCVCAVVQGYGLVVRHSDEPEQKSGIPLDQPLFHWTNEEQRFNQTVDWFAENWGIPKKALKRAARLGVQSLENYRTALAEEGSRILEEVRSRGEFAIVIGGRPYHNDMLVNHHVASHFTSQGIAVMTLEGLPGIYDQDLDTITRMEVTNSYHARLLSSAEILANDPALELVQIVSFGCGHDATLSDELIRMLHDRGEKEVLILKLDEGDVRGPLNIRIKSFIETVKSRREANPNPEAKIPGPLFPKTFEMEDRETRTILIPNLSVPFSHLSAKVFESQGYKTRQLPLGAREASDLGKKYVHNDMCFPAQINIGEALHWLETNDTPQDEVAFALAKNCDSCRAGQYAALARKAFDEAGYDGVPICTTGTDTKGMHNGFEANTDFYKKMVWGVALMDAMEGMVRATRPYEIHKGETQEIYEHWFRKVLAEVVTDKKKALRSFEQCVEEFNAIEVDRSERRPRVAVLGEILMKYHAGANGFVEKYLESHGMEVIQPGMLDFFRRYQLVKKERVKRNTTEQRFKTWLIAGISEHMYGKATGAVNKIHRRFKFYEHHANCYEMAERMEGIVDITYNTGETWLIPAEIMTLADQGCNSFIILQPFGCLANHITGRGLTKAVKRAHPHVQIQSLDYDPDVSFANIENRLQMLIINARELQKVRVAAGA